MGHIRWQVLLGISLIALSALFYLIQYGIFGDARQIVFYLAQDIAFVPIEVLLVTLIIHRLLSMREKRAKLKKLNMVIGAFFSEVGRELLGSFCCFDRHCDLVRKNLILGKDWSRKEFSSVSSRFKNYEYVIDSQRGDLGDLRRFLTEKRNFLLRLLENPNLLEHDSFTNLLWAVFHLTEELSFRKDTRQLPDTDYEHLAGDMRRAYSLLVCEWLAYMGHLRNDYPYLFSLAIRTNPFDLDATAEVR